MRKNILFLICIVTIQKAYCYLSLDDMKKFNLLVEELKNSNIDKAQELSRDMPGNILELKVETPRRINFHHYLGNLMTAFALKGDGINHEKTLRLKKDLEKKFKKQQLQKDTCSCCF